MSCCDGGGEFEVYDHEINLLNPHPQTHIASVFLVYLLILEGVHNFELQGLL